MSKWTKLNISLLAATILVWFVPTAMLAQQSMPSGAQWGEITGDSVRVRAGASTQYQALATASRGERYIMIGQRGGWAELQATHVFDCFVHGSLVAVNGGTGTINGDNVILRLQPNTQAFRLGTVSRQTTVEVVEQQGEWYKIVPPAGVSVWVSAEYIRAIGPVSANEFEAYRLGRPVDSGASAVQYPASSESSAQAGNGTGSRDRIRQAEEMMLAELDERFAAAMAAAGRPSADAETVAGMRSLAHEYDAFADACQTEAVAEQARERAAALRVARDDLHAALTIRETAQQPEETAEVQPEREAESPAAPRSGADDAARQRALERLLYRPSEDFVAVGQVGDARDAHGRRVYILVRDGEVLYRILLSPEAGEVDLRSLWHRTVAVRGRIVKIDGEQFPTIVCTTVVPQ